MVRIHQSNYQQRDREIINYELCNLPGSELNIRGPIPNLNNPYFTAIGAAQTFGCFCEDPYPKLLSSSIGLPFLNLGFGGAGPEFFIRNDMLLNLINKSRFCIVQIMSARSVSNSCAISLGSEYAFHRKTGKRISTHNIFNDYYSNCFTPQGLTLINRAKDSLKNLFKVSKSPFIKDLIAESRQRWVSDYTHLSYLIKVPTILLWFSQRSPCYKIRYSSLESIFGCFPQLVNQEMVASITQYFGPYVECVSSRGIPQALISRASGNPVVCLGSDDRKDLASHIFSENTYYPSPEMHIDASQILQNTVMKWADYLG